MTMEGFMIEKYHFTLLKSWDRATLIHVVYVTSPLSEKMFHIFYNWEVKTFTLQ